MEIGGIKMTITLKVSENTKQKMISYFEEKKRAKTPPYAIFQADEEDTVVTLYESGKAVFQGISADIDANMWMEMEKHLNPNAKIDRKDSSQKKEQKEILVDPKFYYATSIGSDEVGTGDYFGPIIVSAAYVKKEDISFLEELGVKDSKKLNDNKILEIVPKILKRIPYASIELTNQKYNESYKSDMNMNKIKAILHNKVLWELSHKYQEYDYIIVDQFAEKFVYYNYLKESTQIVRNITFLTKGESKSLAVACASLISRYLFVKKFELLQKNLGMVLPKGAGEQVDKIGKEIAEKYGFEKLHEIAKLNFKNTDKIKNM